MVNEWNKSTVECIECMNIEVKKKVNGFRDDFHVAWRLHVLRFLQQVRMPHKKEQHRP